VPPGSWSQGKDIAAFKQPLANSQHRPVSGVHVGTAVAVAVAVGAAMAAGHVAGAWQCRPPNPKPISESPLVQAELARAEIAARSAELLLFTAME
jgi:alkylation response protein AidB-like acyl-CoA dehydrogenase